MFSNTKLMRNFCIEAVRTTVYLVNRSHAIAINWKTPNEVWSGNLHTILISKYLVALHVIMLLRESKVPGIKREFFLGMMMGSRVIKFGLLILNWYIVGMLLLMKILCFTREWSMSLQEKKVMSRGGVSHESKQEPCEWFNYAKSKGCIWAKHNNNNNHHTTCLYKAQRLPVLKNIILKTWWHTHSV